MQEQNYETVRYMAGGLIRRFKVSKNNPRDFKIGDKYIVVDTSVSIQVVNSEKNAEKINQSIMSGDKIRRCLE